MMNEAGIKSELKAWEQVDVKDDPDNPLRNSVCRSVRGYFFYDGCCVCCVFLARRLRTHLWNKGYILMPAQAPWARARLGLGYRETPGQATLMLADGSMLKGGDALRALMITSRRLRPFVILTRKSGYGSLFSGLYGVWRALRHRIFPRCRLVDVHRECVESYRPSMLR